MKGGSTMNFAALRYEELSLNTSSSFHTEVYDGWILRFREKGDWHDSCVIPLYLSTRSYEDKIEFCEKKFASRSLPCAFKMTSNVSSALDQQLEQRGYALLDKTKVLECPEGGIPAGFKEKEIAVEQPKPDCRREGKRITASVREKGMILAGGMGVFEEDTIGLYDIYVNPKYRRRGLGTAICRALMEEGFRGGARSAHLQVLASGTEALSLYRSLGFREVYCYWYRVKA